MVKAELSTAATTSAAALKGSTSSQQPKVRLTADSIKGLKHDINVMKQVWVTSKFELIYLQYL